MEVISYTSQFGPEDDLLKEIKEWGAETAQEAKKKQEMEMEYAESLRRIKLYVPKSKTEQKSE